MINLKKFKDLNIYFIGIGGISMSALANFSLSFGANVKGSDCHYSHLIQKLEQKGVKFFLGHNAQNITPDINLVVYSGAISAQNLELVRAKELKIDTMERSEFLGQLCKLYNNVVAVSGTHGKTTTTAMVSDIFIRAGLFPTVHLGGESVKFGNYLMGNNDIFVTEGCEYRNSVKHICPTTAVITNIELDHMDFYHNLDEIKNAFLQFVQNSTKHIIVFENNDFAKMINTKAEVITCGFNGEYDIVGKNLKFTNSGVCFDAWFKQKYLGRFVVNLCGAHNAKNALCAICVAIVNEVDISIIYSALKAFKGVKRRYEKVGYINKIPVICDYAHHPTEILNSIATTKQHYKRILCVFQPHTYTRTKELFKQFLTAFKGVNKLIVYKTYPAREKYVLGGGAKDLYNKITQKKAFCGSQKGLTKEILKDANYDAILILGAGDIYDIINKIIKRYNKQN